MRKFFYCLFTLFFSVGLFAQQQPVVAVAPFDAISGVSTADANMITRVFFIRLGNTRQVNLVDRTVVDRIIKEHNFQAGDWSNQQKTAELGSALNADWIVRGELEKFGTNILVTVQFYDIRTFRFMGGTDSRLANMDEAYDKMDPLVNKLIEIVGSVGVKPAAGGTPPAADRNTPSRAYKIGDVGPAGGIVFFDRGFIGDGWRYLEAASAGAEVIVEWGTFQQNVANTMTMVGSGKKNTQIIVERLKALKQTNRAAQVCAALDINGYKDWFLPSKDELDLLYRNLKEKELGNFGNEWYWSSSQDDVRNAWAQRFNDGRQNDERKNYAFSVRAIRQF